MALDFSGENLRGRNFKGRKDLAGANFSYADIRGANFTNANLTGANFSHAKAGLQRRWAIFLVLVSLLLSGLSGFFWAFNGYLVWLIFNSSRDNKIAGWVALITLIAFFFITIRQGIIASLGAGSVAIAFAVAFAGAGNLAFAVAFAFAGVGAGAFTGAGAFAGAIAFALAFAGAGAGSVAVVAFAFAIAGAGAITFAIIGAGAVAIPIIGGGAMAFAGAGAGAGTIAVAFTGAGTGTLFTIYISWRAMKGDQKHSLIRNIAIAFAATGGTSFRGANLTNADFTQATLKSTDLRNTILTCSRWHQAKMLDRVRPGSTYLQNPQVRQLLVTGQGQDKIFLP